MPADWSLKPAEVEPGERFRLLLVTSGRRNGVEVATRFYNEWVTNQIRAGGHAAIVPFADQFRAIVSGSGEYVYGQPTPFVNARDNINARGAGMPIYWLNGPKVADDYADFYDGSWDSDIGRTEAGTTSTGNYVWTGTENDGTGPARPGNRIGWATPLVGSVGPGRRARIFAGIKAPNNLIHYPLFALSPVFEVEVRPLIAWTGSQEGTEGETLQFEAQLVNPRTRERVRVRHDVTAEWSISRLGKPPYGADAETDATPGRGTLTIPAGSSTATVDITLVDDTEQEGAEEATETFLIGFSSTTGADLGNQVSVRGTIHDNDGGIAVSFTEPPSLTEVAEGSRVTVTMQLSGPAPRNLSIPLTCELIAATEADFRQSVPRLIRFPRGETEIAFTFEALRDREQEELEYVGFSLGDTLPAGVRSGNRQAALLAIADGPPGTSPGGVTASDPVRCTDGNHPITRAGNAPTNLRASNTTHDSVTLAWDAPEGVDVAGYQVLARNRDTDAADAFEALVQNTGSTATSHEVTGLAAETRYEFRAKAHTGGGELTAESDGVNVDTPAAPAEGELAAPTNLRASNITHGGATLAWDAPEDVDVAGYRILIRYKDRDPVGQFAVLVDDTGSTTTSYEVTGLQAGTRHVFRVKARTTDGRLTPQSEWVDVDTPALPIPTNLRASDITHNSVNLAWDAPDGVDVASYQVLVRYKDRDPDGVFAVLVENTGSTSTSYRVTGLEAETRHVFRVKAHTTDGQLTRRSSYVDVDTPAAPAGGASAGPSISGTTSFTVTEGDTAVGTLSATDADTAAEDLEWSLAGGADEDAFRLSGEGVLRFAGAKDYENPDDAGGDGAYEVRVEVSDGDQSDSADVRVTLANRNEAPSADAGSDQEDVEGGSTVTLRGSGTDPDDGATLTYEWSQTGGTSVTLSSVSPAEPTFTAPADLSADETLTFRLRVTDEDGLSDEDDTRVTVLAAPADPDGTRDGATELDADSADGRVQYAIARDTLERDAGDEVDYYAFRLRESKELGLGIRGQSIDLDASIEDSSGRTIIRSWPPPDESSVEWLRVLLDPGRYYIRVEATEDGRTEYRVRFGLEDPNRIAVADAQVEESAGAALDFEVSLDREPGRGTSVSVRYETVDGTAHAGSDYTATSGTLTFEHGESTKTVSVPVLEDDHDEERETLTLRLSSPSGGELSDAEATGTIANADPLPRALLARFGRTAAVHIVEHVEERLQAPREPGFRGRFAGRELRRGMERDMALGFLSGMAGSGARPASAGGVGAGMHNPLSGSPGGGGASFGAAARTGAGRPMAAATGQLGTTAGPMGAMAGPGGGPAGRGLLDLGLGGGDVLTGSAFALNRQTRHGGILSLWSRGARSSFHGQEGALALNGDVRTTMFGADYAKGPLVMGLSLANSRGLGGYAGYSTGQVASSVTGLYPWLGYQATERVSVWGVTGYGAGAMLLTPGDGAALESDLSMKMAAAGTRGELVDGGANDFGLAFKADALWVGTATDGVDGPAGRLAATAAAVTRVRTALEGSRGFTFGGGLSLTPSAEVGLRHDAGDAETGSGLDVGGGLVVSDPSTGLSADVRVRMLLLHQAEGFRERGVSVSFSYNPTPSTPLGFMARVAPSWGGQAMGGAEALWGRDTMAGMAHGGVAAGNRLDADLGYGLPVGSRFVGTPTVGFGTSEYGRDYWLGYSLGVLQNERMRFEVGVDAQRRESPMVGGTSNGVLGRATVGW